MTVVKCDFLWFVSLETATMAENNDNMTEQASRVPEMYNITMEDSNWIMTSAFIIFTMQTGI